MSAHKNSLCNVWRKGVGGGGWGSKKIVVISPSFHFSVTLDKGRV
jgi:hypothetical protein